MIEVRRLKLLQKDLSNLSEIIDCRDYDISEKQFNKQIKTLLLNLEDHLEEFLMEINY